MHPDPSERAQNHREKLTIPGGGIQTLHKLGVVSLWGDLAMQ